MSDRKTAYLDACRKAAEGTGKTLDFVIQTMAPTWGFGPIETGELLHLAKTTPAPLGDQEITRRQQLVDQARTEREQRIERESIAAAQDFLALQETNPFAAAARMRDDQERIAHGLDLIRSTTKDEPPSAA